MKNLLTILALSSLAFNASAGLAAPNGLIGPNGFQSLNVLRTVNGLTAQPTQNPLARLAAQPLAK